MVLKPLLFYGFAFMKKRVLNVILMCFAAAAVIGFLMLLGANNIIICPFNRFFNVLCPGCGITRAAFCLLNFNFLGALKQNPILFLILFYCGFYFVYFAVNYIKTGKKILYPFKPAVNIVFLILITAFTVLRNIFKF